MKCSVEILRDFRVPQEGERCRDLERLESLLREKREEETKRKRERSKEIYGERFEIP